MKSEKRKKSNASIASMTGYGRASGESPTGRVTVETRSLNHRYLEVIIRAPKTAMHLDPVIRTYTKDVVARGKVELFINIESHDNSVAVDLDRAMKVSEALKEVAEPLGDKVRLEHVLAVGEITSGMEKEITAEYEDLILEAVKDALDNLDKHRKTEGRSLEKDIMSRMEDLSGKVSSIEALAPQVTDRVRKQVNEFIAGLNLGDLPDQQRLEVEIALLSQRSDITEELTRLKAHLSAFASTVSSGGVVGRRLDFLLQEIQREINTIGSKSGLTEISGLVIDFKTELEKVREQVQNIE